MKNLFHHSLALLGLSVLAAVSVPTARAQVTPTTIFVLTNNFPASMPANTTSNLYTAGTVPTNNVISLRQGVGMARQYTFAGQNPGTTGNLVVTWAFSGDGTNFTTGTANGSTADTATGSGTNAETFCANTPSTTVNNMLFAAPYSVQNTGTNALTNISGLVSFGNLVPGSYP